jgi:hypothetical protein
VNYQTQPTIKVIDSIMGSGKTTYIIDQLKKEKDRSKRFLIVTPYLKETDRFIGAVPNLCLKTPEGKDAQSKPKPKPKSKSKSKSKSKVELELERRFKSKELMKLIDEEQNIVITHSLLNIMSTDTCNLLAAKGYDLISDETLECVRQYGDKSKQEHSSNDINRWIDSNYVSIGDDGYLKWKGSQSVEYNSILYNLKRDCDNQRITIKRRPAVETSKRPDQFFWEFPINHLRGFKSITVLTYMFDASLMHAYFQSHGIDWEHLTLTNNHELVKWNHDIEASQALSIAKHLHVLVGDKVNDTGEERYSYSASGLRKMNIKQRAEIERAVRNALQNYFGARSCTTMWSCIKDFRLNLAPKGFKKAFVACNVRATNEYRDRSHLAYLRNIYTRSPIFQYFGAKGIKLDQDRYAVSELLQWVFRSAIRDEKEVHLYLPSKRMRTLLHEWSGGVCKV